MIMRAYIGIRSCISSTILGSWVKRTANCFLKINNKAIVNNQKMNANAIEVFTYFKAFFGKLDPKEFPTKAHTTYDMPRGKL